jgi:glycosyltransferase involved in cell wall biosynthesis
MGKWTVRIADHLRARGHEVEELYAHDLVHPGRLARHLFGVALAIWLTRNASKIDVAIAHEPHAGASTLLHQLLGACPPVIVMSHGVESRVVRELKAAADRGLSGTSGLDVVRHELMWGWREALAFRAASHVLCLSEGDRRFLVERMGVGPKRLTMLINGADPAREEDPGRREDSTVLCLGSWIEEKGRTVLPRLWKRVRQRRPRSRLILAGTGASEPTVLRAFDESDRHSVTVVSSFGSLNEIGAVFARATLFLLPSLREGSPLALLEAMSHGLPVVAASVGGVPEIVTDGREGLLYDSLSPEQGADKVVALLERPDNLTRLGAAARERAGGLSWAKTAEVVERACLNVARKGIT